MAVTAVLDQGQGFVTIEGSDRCEWSILVWPALDGQVRCASGAGHHEREHRGVLPGGTAVVFYADDRRAYAGTFPGYCRAQLHVLERLGYRDPRWDEIAPDECILPLGHDGEHEI